MVVAGFPGKFEELTIGKSADRYVFTKSIDSLGILSYAGDLRAAGCIAMMDVKFEASRGRTLGVEDFKAVWDTMEGGCIKDTRYKPAALPAGVPRVMGLQGAPDDAGLWFKEHGQDNLGRYLQAIAPREGAPETVSAFRARVAELVKTFTAHEQAILRRVSIGVPTQPLVSSAFVQRLEGGNQGAAAAQRAKRAAYWAARALKE
jgi:hypothetical protein